MDMANRTQDLNIIDLFDRENGIVKASIYSDPDVYKLEMERIFSRSWLFLGHEGQIPKFGDFLVTTMAEDSVIVSRQGDGTITAILNQCRHRGNRLCLADMGNSKSFRCTYHGWVYNSAGGLVGMPHETDGYHNKLNKAEWGAIRVPRVEIHKGLIFGNWDAEAPALSAALGDVAWYLDAFLDGAEGGIELSGPHRHHVKCNWKWQAEQHGTDFYHAAISHNSALTALNPPGAPPTSFEYTQTPDETGYQFGMPELGHGAAGWFPARNDGLVRFAPAPAPAYLGGPAREEMRARLGDIRTDEMGSLVMTVFPNLSLNRAARYLRVWQPRGPNRTEVVHYIILDKKMPEEVKDAIVRGTSFSFNASGLFEQDDSENVALCHRGASEGHISRQTPLNVQMGLGFGGPHPDFPGQINHVYAEEGARAFYSHWQDLLMGGAK
nr:aromatic ring-hydroxylating dioxygenase subunit alpha [Sphingobium wenxiniae]